MKSYSPTYYTLGSILIALGAIAGIYTILHAVYYAPEKEVTVANAASPFFLATSSIPVHISIPSINVSAKVEEVGITYKGNMSTPKVLIDTGWYKYGTIPGLNGSAVIDGHVDNGFSLPGVFKHLKEMHIGDDVYLDTNGGTKLHFKVIDIQTYYYTDVPLTLLFNRTGDTYLNLITCDGTWINDAQTDDHRVVVFTKLVR